MSQRWGWLGFCCLLVAGGCVESKKASSSRPASLTQPTNAGEPECNCCTDLPTSQAPQCEPDDSGAVGQPAALVLADTSATVRNYDWPQWQGPDRTAISRETGLTQQWPPEGPPLAWQARGLGQGYSTPSIAEGRI